MNSITLKPEITELYTLNEFVSNELPEENTYVNLIVEEVFVNIVDYSKADFIIVEIEYENGTIMLNFIDNGISLCDINDIERGIKSIRDLLLSGDSIDGNTPMEQLFAALMDATRKDYGSLLRKGTPEFIDLVRWAYKREFWQQTLTLIESRAPQDFIDKGFYFCT